MSLFILNCLSILFANNFHSDQSRGFKVNFNLHADKVYPSSGVCQQKLQNIGSNFDSPSYEIRRRIKIGVNTGLYLLVNFFGEFCQNYC